MKTWLTKIDDKLCLWFCTAKGFVSLIEQQLDLDEVSHVLTPECRARAGWTDFQ